MNTIKPSSQTTVDIADISISNNSPFVLIAGPDSIESYEHAKKMAESIKKIANSHNVPFIFKASYDKANRTSINSFRGVGAEQGLNILSRIRDELDIPVTTDAHSPEETIVAAKVVDLLQIPALLSRQTDILVAAGESNTAVNIKKGQFIAPHDMNNVIEKASASGNSKILVTERGTTFGYNDVVADMRGLEIMKNFGQPVIFDASHTVQTPSGLKSTSGGDRSLTPPLARAAIAVGIAGLFIEVHNDPDNAPVDGMSSLDLKDLPVLLKSLRKIDESVK